MTIKLLNFVLPAAMIGLGLAGALQSNAMDKSRADSGAVMGYKRITSPTPGCTAVQICNEQGNLICKSSVDNSNLYRLDAPNSCPDVLFHRP